ncbi:D-ribose ABC transporter substrate-binding protein [Phycicoccus sp. BSK3Z-2]|uniref:D-ribose ABC transporter substrate-binding protein n=1 Tax=Phycicoccus avicenniae TaxID=2828860 RepID=A0A941I1T0_9MICO|nr:D-ribose ABC transporter substrate-binding protein [Phycicoccus avicenniae]MBR7744621.1 D-ribose ABC transporter substrate-binding protein [Phycicoccus avicenniae]
MFRTLTKATVALVGSIALAACGSSDADTSAGASGDEGGGGGGTIAVITVDPSNPYWKAEVDTAVAEAEKLGYETTVDAHNNDADRQNQFIDGAISKQVDAIILDPAGADESVGAVQKATDAGIPVFLVNAEISEQGIAKSQIVSNNAQGATIGAEAWVEAVGGEGKYVELFGNPTDNNAQVRSDGYAEVLAQYPDLELVQQETANWDRAEGKAKMEIMLRAHPDIVGVVSGNDEMALGAIQALKDAGKLDQVTVLGFDGNPDAAAAVEAGEMVATVLQPIVDGTTLAVQQADAFLTDGETGASTEKQAIDCILITEDNVGQLDNFVMGG